MAGRLRPETETVASPDLPGSKATAVLERTLHAVEARGWALRSALNEVRYQEIVEQGGFYEKNLPLAFVIADIVAIEKPMTVRRVLYALVSSGWLPSTAREHYNRTNSILNKLRERGIIPFEWVTDHVRETLKPSSWSGLQDYADTVRDAYRRDFWASLPEYVHIFCEKDAMAGVLEPVTRKYDVPLSIIRGFVSISFAHEIAEMWNSIEKPIRAYYLGDFDPSGLAIEQDLQDKLERYCLEHEGGGRRFTWQRLAVLPEDFETFDLIPLSPKDDDSRTAGFRERGYEHCAEVDAIPAPELRQRLRNAIESHIPQGAWRRLQRIEQLERRQFRQVMRQMGRTDSLDVKGK